MARSNSPNRWKGLAVGIVGGFAGAIVRHYYEHHIAPQYFPPLAPPARLDNDTPDPVEARAYFAPQYRADETSTQAAARIGYAFLNGKEPREAETMALAVTIAELAQGIAAGASYGATRTTTRARDIAGGFFYGIRLWLGETIMPVLFGFRPGPTRFSPAQHARLLTAYWVYTFTTTAVTRLLYRLLSPEDWE